MKIKRFIMLFLILGIFSSCTKFLDVQPESAISTSKFYQNTEEVNNGVIACYDGLQNLYGIDYQLTGIRGENSKAGLSLGVYELIEHFGDGPSSNTVAEQYWSYAYNTIFRANTVLANIQHVTDPDLKQQYKGEALFIRSLCYFNMVRLFGDVPLVTKVITPSEQSAFARTPSNIVYDTIVSDLKMAANDLPVSYSSSNDLGRATKGAALGILAKVYLTLHQYSDAETLTQELMTSPFSYSLMPNFNDVFYQEMNNEILFAVRYSTAAGEGQYFSSEMLPSGSHLDGLFPMPSLLSLFSPNDKRFSTTFYATKGDTVCGKYLSTDPPGSAGNDWVVLRYADVLLMYAEASNQVHNGPTQPAIDAINAIRTRAGLTTYTVNDFNQSTFSTAIYNESRRELAFEDHNWFTVLRMGIADSVMTAEGQREGFTFESYRKLFPIPQTEIDASQGKLSQNTGY